jgi:hypothetical protein
MISGIFPTRLKYAAIEPILKNGYKKNVANYRLIYILSSFPKILQKIRYIILMNHLETNSILAVEQFDFRTSSSTEQASFNFVNNILNESKKNNESIFLDLQKAFNFVNHDILLNKLSLYGITGGFFQSIKTYLHNRYQRVVLNNKYFISISDWGEITHGVPQGSILGPLLFLLYINDLPHSINKNNKIVLFADDTSLIISNPDPIKFRDDVNKILQHIQEWFNANLMSLNWEKTHFMHFTTKNNSSSNLDIIYKDKKLTTVDSIKFLGSTLHNSLSWKKHIEAIVPKLSAATFAMTVVQPLLPLDSLKLIYYSYFHSILTYGIIFCGNTPTVMLFSECKRELLGSWWE